MRDAFSFSVGSSDDRSRSTEERTWKAISRYPSGMNEVPSHEASLPIFHRVTIAADRPTDFDIIYTTSFLKQCQRKQKEGRCSFLFGHISYHPRCNVIMLIPALTPYTYDHPGKSDTKNTNEKGAVPSKDNAHQQPFRRHPEGLIDAELLNDITSLSYPEGVHLLGDLCFCTSSRERSQPSNECNYLERNCVTSPKSIRRTEHGGLSQRMNSPWLRLRTRYDNREKIYLRLDEAPSSDASIMEWIVPVEHLSDTLRLFESLRLFAPLNILHATFQMASNPISSRPQNSKSEDSHESHEDLSKENKDKTEREDQMDDSTSPKCPDNAQGSHFITLLAVLHNWSVSNLDHHMDRLPLSRRIIRIGFIMGMVHRRLTSTFHTISRECINLFHQWDQYFPSFIRSIVSLSLVSMHEAILKGITCTVEFGESRRPLRETSLTMHYLYRKMRMYTALAEATRGFSQEYHGSHGLSGECHLPILRSIQYFTQYVLAESAVAMLVLFVLASDSLYTKIIRVIVPVDALNHQIQRLSAHLINSPLGIKFHKLTQDFIWIGLVNNLSQFMYDLWSSVTIFTSTWALRCALLLLGIYGGPGSLVCCMVDVFRLATMHLRLLYQAARYVSSAMIASTKFCWKVSINQMSLFDSLTTLCPSELRGLFPSIDTSAASTYYIMFDSMMYVSVIAAIALGILAYFTPSLICFFGVSWFLAFLRIFIARLVMLTIVPCLNWLSECLASNQSELPRLYDLRQLVESETELALDAHKLLFPVVNIEDHFLKRCILRGRLAEMFRSLIGATIPPPACSSGESTVNNPSKGPPPACSSGESTVNNPSKGLDHSLKRTPSRMVHYEMSIRRLKEEEIAKLPLFEGFEKRLQPMRISLLEPNIFPSS